MLSKTRSKVDGKRLKGSVISDSAISDGRKCWTYFVVLTVLVCTFFVLLFMIWSFQPGYHPALDNTKFSLQTALLRSQETAPPSSTNIILPRSSINPFNTATITHLIKSPSENNSTSKSTLSSDSNSEESNAVEIAITRIDPEHERWKQKVAAKLSCLRSRRMAFYLYHVRKAAGTTVRDVTRLIAFRQRVPFYETEGIVLNERLLSIPELFTVITFRDPIARIFSLYWYEHVGWFSGILKQPHRCKTMQEWIAAWKDGSSHKEAILTKFPLNNYVEIENYYVKLLIGYNHNDRRALTIQDLDRAKIAVQKFDLILITEWLNDETEHNLLHKLYQTFYLQNSNREIIIPQKVRGDPKLKIEMSSQLAAKEVSNHSFLE